MAASGIEWTERTWNPATGCEQVSAGCDNCYAMRLVNTRQIANSRSPRFGHPFNEVMLHENRLVQPTTWKNPTRVFVNSMSDVWHRDIPDAYIDAWTEYPRRREGRGLPLVVASLTKLPK